MNILKNLSTATTTAVLITIGIGTAQAATLTFEDVGDLAPVGNFYNTAPNNFGVTFSDNALGLVSQFAPGGGSGRFHDQPSGTTVLSFQLPNSVNNQNSVILNDPSGFNTLSFYYAAITNGGAVSAYSDVNDSGSKIASQVLITTPSDGGPSGTNKNVYGPFSLVTISLPSIAKSIDFSGNIQQILFDDITLTSSSSSGGTTGSGITSVPEPSSVLGLLAFGIIGAISTLKSKLRK